MPPLASAFRAARLALCLLAALALPGCEKLVDIEVSVSSALLDIAATSRLQPRHAGTFTSLGKSAGEFLRGLYKAPG